MGMTEPKRDLAQVEWIGITSALGARLTLLRFFLRPGSTPIRMLLLAGFRAKRPRAVKVAAFRIICSWTDL